MKAKGRGVQSSLPFAFLPVPGDNVLNCQDMMTRQLVGIRRFAWRSLLLALVAGGCYRLTPIEGSVPDAGREVRIGLSDAGSLRMAPLVGPRIEAIDGRAIESNDSAIVVAVEAVVAQNGRSMAWNQERLSVPRDAVSSLQARALDVRKTWIVAGLSILGVIALGDAFGLGTGFGGFFGIGGGGGRQ
jgi:hypothetical protein